MSVSKSWQPLSSGRRLHKYGEKCTDKPVKSYGKCSNLKYCWDQVGIEGCGWCYVKGHASSGWSLPCYKGKGGSCDPVAYCPGEYFWKDAEWVTTALCRELLCGALLSTEISTESGRFKENSRFHRMAIESRSLPSSLLCFGLHTSYACILTGRVINGPQVAQVRREVHPSVLEHPFLLFAVGNQGLWLVPTRDTRIRYSLHDEQGRDPVQAGPAVPRKIPVAR